MIDEFERDLLPAAFEVNGGVIDLAVTRASDRFGRVLSEHEYPYREGARIRDMGGIARRTRVSLVFIPPDVVGRVNAMVAAWKRGQVGRLTHPVFGSFAAYVEDFSVDVEAEARDYVVASCSFVEDIESAENARELFPGATDDTPARAALDDVERELADRNLTSDTPAAVRSQLAAWESADRPDRQELALQLAALSNRLQADIDRFDLATDVGNYPLVIAFISLQNNLRNLVDRVAATTPALTTYTVRVRRPLLAILQDLYGGAGAIARFERTLSMNTIREPHAVEPGTVLTIETP